MRWIHFFTLFRNKEWLKVLPKETLLNKLGQLEKHFFNIIDLNNRARAEYLANIREQDPSMAKDLADLLSASEAADDLFEKPLLRDPTKPWNQILAYIDSKLQKPPLQIGPYRIERLLGEGGMGVVYKGVRQDIYQEVALKILRTGRNGSFFWKRFETERQALALMEHENIAHFYDSGTTEANEPYLAMEFVDGEPIAQFCEARHLDMNRRLKIFMQVCDGMVFAHSRGVIHGDLKPQNILVITRPEGDKPKIIDFGIARSLGTSRGLFDEDAYGDAIIGSPRYMSPEQSQPNATLDVRWDVYSLGAVLFELITGGPILSLPDARHKDELLKAIRMKPRLKLAGFLNQARATSLSMPLKRLKKYAREDLQWIVDKATSLNPKDRYETVKDLRDDLLHFVENRPVAAAPSSFLYRFGKWRRRHRFVAWSSITAAVGLFTAFAMTVVALHRTEKARESLAKVSQTHSFYNQILSTPHPERFGSDITFLEVLKVWETQVDNSFENDPEQAANLHVTLGNTCFGLGLYERSLPHFQRANQLRRQVLGPQHEQTKQTVDRLAYLDYFLAKYSQAESRFLTQINETRPDSGLYLSALRGLLNVYIKMNRHDAAKEVAHQLEKQASKLPEAEENRLAIDAMLAIYYEYQGHYAEAERLWKRVLHIQKMRYGDGHPKTLLTMYNLGSLLHTRGFYDDALAIKRQAADAQEHTLGANHPYTLKTKHGIVLDLHQLGHSEQALAMNTAVLSKLRLLFGKDHERTLMVTHTQAVIYGSLGDAEKALVNFQNLVDGYRALGKLNSRKGTQALNNLAHYLKVSGQYDQAEQACREAIQLKAQYEDPWSDTVLSSQFTLAQILYGKGQQAEGEQIMDAVLQLVDTHYQAEPGLSAKYKAHSGLLLAKYGNWERAENLLVESFHLFPSNQRLKRSVGQTLFQYFEKTGDSNRAEMYRQ